MTAGVLVRYLRLSLFFGGIGLHRLVTYRLDFLLGAFSFLIRTGAQTAVLTYIFRQVPSVGGWGFEQTLFLYGFFLLPRGLDHVFTDQLWEVGRKLVRTGEFHKYLIRPSNTLYGVLSERFLYPDGFGEVLVGVALTGYAGHRMHLHLSAVQVVLLPVLVAGGAVIFASVKLLLASAAFWTTDSLPAMDATYQTSSFAAYPLDIYHPTLRSLLMWLLPFAFTSYAPAKYLLFGDTGLLRWMPVVSTALVAAALTVWVRGVRRYEMSGT